MMLSKEALEVVKFAMLQWGNKHGYSFLVYDDHYSLVKQCVDKKANKIMPINIGIEYDVKNNYFNYGAVSAVYDLIIKTAPETFNRCDQEAVVDFNDFYAEYAKIFNEKVNQKKA